MNAISCPVCTTPFREVVRDGILIDVCPKCNGVWLDRGELEKLLSAVRTTEGSPTAQMHQHRHSSAPDYGHSGYGYEEDGRRHAPAYGYGHGYPYPYRYRKKSKLEKLLDVFD